MSRLGSLVCRREHWDTPWFAHWNAIFAGATPPGEHFVPQHVNFHRKTWEWAAIAQALSARGMLAPGRRGCGFAVGREPLASVFARHGVDVLATDLAAADAGAHGWSSTGQHAASLDALLAVRASGAANDKAPVGAMLTIEGLQNLEGKVENLDSLYAAGFRMAGLTHFFDNDIAGSMHGVKKGGLTQLGRKVVAAMEDKGMIVDIAHCSHKCVGEILAMARRPVVSSHGGVQATCKTNRNLSDDEIRGVARTGGVIGIGYWDGAICDTDPRAAARAMKHVKDLVGVQYVALGSDYDGATTVRFDTGQLVQVTQALLDEGFTPDEIRAVMGGNALRVIRAGLVPLAQVKPEPQPEQMPQQ